MNGICTGHPGFYRVTHRYPRKYWLPANWAIEAAYPNKNKVLFGSQFAQGGGYGTKLPQGFGGFSKVEIATWNRFLDGFRGLENQLMPDIIDFGNRVFYEIKTEKFVEEGQRQLMGYHKLAVELTTQLGIPPFDPSGATRYPPPVMPLPGSVNKIVCTERTNHNATPNGLLLYSVWKALEDQEDDDETAAAAVALQDLAELLGESRAKISNELRQPKNYQPSGDYEILAPAALWSALVGQAQMQNTIGMLSEPSRALVHNWAFMARVAGAAAGVPATAVGGGIIFGLAASELLAAAGAATATLGAADTALGGSTLTVAQLAKISAQAANDNMIPLARAAAVLIVVGVASKASAADLTVSGIDAIIVARAEDVSPAGAYSDGRPVTYKGKNYVTVGRGIVL